VLSGGNDAVAAIEVERHQSNENAAEDRAQHRDRGHRPSRRARAARSLTPLAVMMKGYEALQALGGSGTPILIGDWSKVPNFLFPNSSSMPKLSMRADSGQP
jgi:hypothetical protein